MARIDDYRFTHMCSVQQIRIGDQIRCGLLDGDLGTAEITAIESDHLMLNFNLDRSPPPPLPVTLVMALPRPKMLKRTFQTIAAMGVKKLILINAYRVEKSYWSSPLLQPKKIEEHLRLGLEQAGDTQIPEVLIRKRFKPFVEDELPALAKNRRALIAHPYNALPCPPATLEESVLVVGPEGGFIPYEVELMQLQGLQAISLGQRILRVETAVPALLSRLFSLQ